MPTPVKTLGQDFNYFTKITVTSSSFAPFSDITIPFSTQGIILMNEDSSSVVEFSFRGNTLHGELAPHLPSRTLSLDGARVSAIWFRLKTGNSAVISVYAWGIP